MNKIRFVRMNDKAKTPTKGHSSDVAWDFYATSGTRLGPGDRSVFNTGIKMEIPEGYGLILKERSGLAVKQGLRVMAGVIDAGYRGELLVCLLNVDKKHHIISPGDKICQGYFQRVYDFEWEEWDELEDSSRGEGGFGSTGK